MVLKKKDITLLELYLQGGIIPQVSFQIPGFPLNGHLEQQLLVFKVHKGPLAYAEAFLEPHALNTAYSKDLKKHFKQVFKRLVDLYQKGIEAYGLLANQLAGTLIGPVEESANKAASSQAASNAASAGGTTNRCLEMYNLLQQKFGEFENNFRNLLLIDGVSMD